MNKKMSKIMSASDKCYRKKKKAYGKVTKEQSQFHFVSGSWKTSL